MHARPRAGLASGRSSPLVSLEHAALYLAVFFTPLAHYRLESFFFTAGDLLYCISFFLLLISGGVRPMPLGRATSLWGLGFLLLVAGLLGSSLVAGDPMRGLIVTSQYFFAYIALLFILVRDDRRLLHRLMALFIIAIILLDVHGIIYYVVVGRTPTAHGVVTGAGRLATALGDANLAAELNALILPALLYLWLSGVLGPAISVAMLAVMLTTVVLTSSNGGLIAVVISVVAFVGTSMNRRVLIRLLVLGAIGVAFLYFGGSELLPEIFQKRVLGALETGEIDEAGTFADRLDLMKEGIQMISREGIFLIGIGADQFREVSVRGAPVHNMYILILVEGGILALAGWLLFFVIALSLGLSRRLCDPYARAAILATLLVFLAFANFNAHMYARFLLTPVMLVLSLAMIELRSAARRGDYGSMAVAEG